MLDNREAVALGQHVYRQREVITNALRVYAARMTEAAAEARAEYERGQADPVILAAQNRSMVANQGYRHAAELAAGSARRANDAAEEIDRLIDGDEDEAGGEATDGA